MIVEQPPCASKSMQGHSELTLQSKQHFSQTSDPRTATEKGIDDTVQNGGTLKRLQSLDATGMWRKIKFFTRSLQGHSGPVCRIDCRDSVLVSGG